MKSIILLIFYIGSALVIIGYVKGQKNCLPNKIEYRYIPQSFTQREINRLPIRAVFGKMFNNNDPWMNSIGYASDYHIKKLFTYHDPY